MALRADLRPLRTHRHQQPAPDSHRPVRRKPRRQFRCRLGQGCQQLRRSTQSLRRAEPGRRPRQDPPQRARRHHQHRLSVHRVPEGIAAVPQGCQLRRLSIYGNPNRHQTALHAAAGRRPEHHTHQSIGRRGGRQQHPGIHVRVEHSPGHRHTASRQQPQRQHAACQRTGQGKKQQRQPGQPGFTAVGDQSHQYACRRLHRRGGQKPHARQKHRHRVRSSRQSSQQIPPPAQRDPRQPGRDQKQQVVHHPVEDEHAVHIHHCHHAASLPPMNAIIGRSAGERRRKQRADGHWPSALSARL